MKNIISILICTLSLITFGQTFDTAHGKRNNLLDKNGLRQGIWEVRNNYIIATNYSGLGSKTGCRYMEFEKSYLFSKENYKDGVKTGLSEYYSGDKSGTLVKRINYLADGSVIEENVKGNYLLKINADSTIIDGLVYREKDTLAVLCQSKNCNFKTTAGLNLISFKFIDIAKLEYEILSLQMNYYDREIRQQKAQTK